MRTEYVSDNSVSFAVPEAWIEISEPELFNFEKFGDTVSGTLLELKNEQMKQEDGSMRDVLVARIENAAGTQVKIRPSFDLRQKLGKRLLGRRLLIVYDRDNAATQAKGNAMKVFRVFVAPNDSAPEPFVPTDADLPQNF